ncbi:MAG: hypothetical protein QXI97_03695 [Nitrososphaerota archaeon]
MHVFDYLVGCVSGLFRLHNYSPFEKVYASILFIAGLSLGERYCLTHASRESVSILNALTFLMGVLEVCDGKPVIVVDRGPWYQWALKRLGIEYFHETFGVERWFRELKDSQEY